MLNFRKQQLEPIAQATTATVVPFPTSRLPSRVVEAQQQRSYEAVALQLGFAPAQLVRAQLLEFLEESGIVIYDYDQVNAWLAKKKGDAPHWCWRPLREKDIITGYRWGWNAAKSVWEDGFYCSTGKSWECRPYSRLVPQHALEKAAKIEGKFQDQVSFFISDYAHPDVDPFIMVRPKACNDGPLNYRLIFDAWDEPGFGTVK